MNLSQRIELLVQLGQYMSSKDAAWQAAKQKAFAANGWFLPEFIELSVQNIVDRFLQKDALTSWIQQYPNIKENNPNPRLVGLVMAGNIPLVGFHDFLCVFISGHKSLIKASSKDEILIKHIAGKLTEWQPQLGEYIKFADMLKNCDAYIATGSNSSAGYFNYYFGKYAHIIRRNRTSVAILSGKETDAQLEKLADDVYLYFGMGCRNVTKIYVPEHFNFERLINIFKKYEYLADHHKYKNNYDYNLALHILNNKKYMSNAALLIVEDENIFSPVSQLHYEVYQDKNALIDSLKNNDAVQCIVDTQLLAFGEAQCPAINQYADGVDTMAFLNSL